MTRAFSLFLAALLLLPQSPFVAAASAQAAAEFRASAWAAAAPAPIRAGFPAVAPLSPVSDAAPDATPEPPVSPALDASTPSSEAARTNAAANDGSQSETSKTPRSAAASANQEAATHVAVPKTGDASALFDGSNGPNLGWSDLPPVPAEAPDSVAGLSLEPLPGTRYTASPKDWRKEIIYSLILDRFGRAEPHAGWGDPSSATSRHGGNLRGVIEKLDYLKGMGVTTLMINPLYFTLPAAYHDYWPLHFMAVDPHLGTMQDMRDLVTNAHRLGMKVVLDLVFNHAGPVIEYNEGYKFSHERKTIKEWKYPLKPAELAAPENFHLRGSIDNWDDPEQVKYGDFPGGLNQLATERPETQDILLKIGKWWLQQTDVDGFRLDTYSHVAPSFWTRFFMEVRDYAKKLGKDNFLVLGEIYNGDPRALAAELGKGRLDAAFNYPGYFKNNDALHGVGPTNALEDSFNYVRYALGDEVHRLVNFFDNQDKPRFLRAGDPAALSRVALAYALMSVGIPFVYYGTEQAFRPVPSETDLGLDAYREDMFPGGTFRSAGSTGDDFRTDSPLYQHLRALAAARAAHPALSVGEQYNRWSDPNGPGIHAFSRISADEEVVVILNTSGETRSAEMWVDMNQTPVGATLTDELDRSYQIAAHAPGAGVGSKITVQIPPHGVRLMVRRLAPDSNPK